MDVLLWVAVIIIAVWFFFVRGSNRGDGKQVDANVQPLRETNPDPVDDPDEIEIRRATEAHQEVFDRWLSKRDARDAATRDVRQKLKKAEEIVEETSLSDALKQIWRGLEFFSDAEGQEPLWPLPEGFRGLKSESHSTEEKTHQWVWNGEHYGLSKERSVLGDPRWVTLKLTVHDEPVLVLKYDADYGDMVETLEFSDVEALRVGPWISDAIHMAGDLEHAVDGICDETLHEMDREKAAQIELGGQT